ncbi:hypothetical protein JQ604_03265 [Bradyrhizobium jicamae]|uniref:hypothetical protein n=1 Tax=Bradyrhizobium jicamae TaxID=280332 RepID=UPI001BADDAE5|nr:hypothetical protein [Bradyrhizobium jicamae]MBR0751190.1 hypothetical protein [Bradyrhizobium jicamae]
MTFILSPIAGVRFAGQREPFYIQEFHNDNFKEAVTGMRHNWVWRVLDGYGASAGLLRF